MRAVEIHELSGPESALRVNEDVAEPEASHMLTPGSGVVIDVRAAGVSFPELLQTRGEYQVKPDLPFVPGSEVAGVVRSAPEDSELSEGDRVAGFCMLGGWAEVAVAPDFFTFRLPDALDFAQGAGLILNYHTAYFSLKLRGRLAEGQTVLIHGAAGGVGTASIQVAKGLGAKAIAVVSTDEKAEVARKAGADEVLRSDEEWREQAKELSDGGVDVVVDPVGGDRFTDSLRSLGEGGRMIVVGFTAGAIPEVKVNRLLLNNVEVIGAGWGAYVIGKPDLNREIGAAIDELAARRLRRADRRGPDAFGGGLRGTAPARSARGDRQGRPRRRRVSPRSAHGLQCEALCSTHRSSACHPCARGAATAVDDLVERGVFGSRSEAVRAGLSGLVEGHRRAAVGEAIVDGYRAHPQGEDELGLGDAASAAMIAEEPW